MINAKFNWPVFKNKNDNFGYLPIPKAGNTSILYSLLLRLEKSEINERLSLIPGCSLTIEKFKPADIHQFGHHLFDDIRNKTDTNGIFTFTCTRHPVSRFESFYRDKILRWDPYIEEKMAFLGFRYEMSIEDCIDTLISVEDITLLDQHVMPMSTLIYYDSKCKADFIFKLEDIDKKFSQLEDIVGCKLPELSKQNESRKEKVTESLLNYEQKKIIERFYELDMNLFDYE